MGETMAETLRDQIEIDKPIGCESAFKESVSFGRFENDLLSWERWSSFSQNKYLEEVEKCSTPGSVASKKAYFEAHYKKIAAQKAEMMDQEEKMEDDTLRSDSPSNWNPVSNGCGAKLDFDRLDIDRVTRSMVQDSKSMPITHIEEPNKDDEDSFVERVSEEVDELPDTPKSSKSELSVLVRDENEYNEPQGLLEEKSDLIKETNGSAEILVQPEERNVLDHEEHHRIEPQDLLEQSQQLDSDKSQAQENKTKDAKSKPQKKLQKRTLASKNTDLAKTTKKPAALPAKTTRTSLSRVSKPAPASPVISTSKISTRKESTPSLPKKSSSPAVKKTATTPKSLHMSLSLEPSNSDLASPATTRRSFIMEKMGDKDIVKRAFRAFQNNFSLSKPSIEEKSYTPVQLSAKGTTRPTSSSRTPQKDKERVTTVENPSSERRQVGARASSVPSRPAKTTGEHRTTAKASPSSLGSKIDERAEKRKELSKKVEKSNAKEVERTRLQSKSKEKKEAGVKKLSESLDLKSTQMPDSYRGQRISKIRGNKVGASTEIHLHSDPSR
ncbi:Wvd2-like [Thalictrum thalictroides]|uniref:Wvd2-like n=1 Tax=Thalictrum thalictroides TaxID=46969 RepID=A0A7J6V6B7_THATH|nr:Wvd2-like [Thalictrum thalictroides]